MARKRDLEAIEARRIEGARLLKRKVAQAEVARRLGVSRQAVSVWARQLEAVNGAVGKLKGKPLGRPRRLEAAQCAALSAALRTGALQAQASWK
jgi:transposase